MRCKSVEIISKFGRTDTRNFFKIICLSKKFEMQKKCLLQKNTIENSFLRSLYNHDKGPSPILANTGQSRTQNSMLRGRTPYGRVTLRWSGQFGSCVIYAHKSSISVIAAVVWICAKTAKGDHVSANHRENAKHKNIQNV